MKLNQRKTQSIFETNPEELKQNILRYNIEQKRVYKSISNVDFKNFWVI